nr:hypothetical protein Itr_chr11CG00430 [Ipomoea trifida]
MTEPPNHLLSLPPMKRDAVTAHSDRRARRLTFPASSFTSLYYILTNTYVYAYAYSNPPENTFFLTQCMPEN